MVELIRVKPVMQQQTSPAVGPLACTLPVSLASADSEQVRKNSKIRSRVGSPSALNIMARSV